MLLNEKKTIKKAYTFLSKDPVMKFFIHSFGDEIDALDRYNDNFAIALCNLIIEQQISFKAAISIKKKFNLLINNLTNKEILKLDDKLIQSVGLSFRKVSYMKNILHFFENEKINIEKTNDSILIKKLSSIKGIGPWTIEMFLLFVCHKPDIFSTGDIALLNSVRINYSVETLDEIKSISLKWEPYRSVASLLLWKSIENKIFYKKRDNHIKDYPFGTRGGT